MRGTLTEAWLSRQEPQLLDHLLVRMTQDEIRLVWAVQWLADAGGYMDYFPLQRFASPGTPEWTDQLGERFLRAIRWLALECGYEFWGMDVERSHRVIGRGKDPIMENRAYILPLAFGAGGFNRLRAMDVAARIGESLNQEFPLDAVKTALSEMEVTVEQAGEQDHESLKRELRLRAEAAAQLRDAVIKIQGGLN